MATVLSSVSGLTLTVATAGLISGCILVTYTLGLAEGQYPAFLPMISDTFVPIPGNYISRMAFSAGQFGLGTVMVMDYYSYIDYKPAGAACAKVWLVLTLIATVCLGIVGAVCENDSPTCLSNGSLHSASAVMLYATLDLYAIYCGITELNSSRPRAVKALLLLLPLVSVSTRIARTPAVVDTLRLGSTALAIFEWTDTAVLMTWLVAHSSKTFNRSYLAGYIGSGKAGATSSKGCGADAPTVLLSSSLAGLCTTFTAVSIGTVALTFAIATANGKVHPTQSWPFLSDLWADKPTNMISRYFVCLGAGITALEQMGHYFLAAPHRTSAPAANRALHGVSLVALVGLSGVGACNEKETSQVHSVCAGVFFGGMGLYIFLDAAWMVTSHMRGHALATTKTTLLLASACAVGFNSYQMLEGALHLGLVPRTLLQLSDARGLEAVAEWTAWVSFLVYVRFHIDVYPEAASYRLAIMKRSTASTHAARLLQSAV